MTLSEPWGLERLTNQERLSFAINARQYAEAWADKAEMIGNGTTADRARRELEFIDRLIANQGELS
jgi:hypothetical protein